MTCRTFIPTRISLSRSPHSSVDEPFVGASLLAKNLRAPRSFRRTALSLTSIASKLAPTYVAL
ncbi:hypothetical protein EJA72_14800 [Pseudomonas sp. PB120]|nr:hypothetical protein [Pseudomonas sp. PB120]